MIGSGREISSCFNKNGVGSNNSANSNGSSNPLPYRFDPFTDDSPNQILKDSLVGLEWGDRLNSLTTLTQEISNFSISRDSTNGSTFLSDPNESISQSDEALGLEFASCKLPFVSTPEPEYNKGWDFLDHPGLNSTTSPLKLQNERDQASQYHGNFYGNSRNSNGSVGTNLSGRNNNLFSFMDSQSQNSPSEEVSKGSNFSSGSSIWNSPTSANSQQQQNLGGLGLSNLSTKETLHYMQLLNNVWEDCKDTGDASRAAQTNTLMQTLQIHLMSKLNAPPSPSTPPMNSYASSDYCTERPTKFRDNGDAADANHYHTWSGHLPKRIHRNATYSCKVFLGGVPWDITEGTLINAFKPFGNVRIDWPKKDTAQTKQKQGYAYVIFEHEKQVKLLLQNCTQDYSSNMAGKWYYKISTNKIRGKDVEVIPWAISESNYVKCQATKIDGTKTIFVGALHGMLNAEALANIMNDLFGGVAYAGIDTDRDKYPIGSGRVTFNNHNSYWKAVKAAYVEIKTSKFKKTVQVDPYVEESTCSACKLQQGPYFCREFSCFRYFCRTCYHLQHTGEAFRSHRCLMRNGNKPQVPSTVHGGSINSPPFNSGRNSGDSRDNNNYNNSYNNSYNNRRTSVGNGNNSPPYNFQQRYEQCNPGSNNSRFLSLMR